VAAGSVRAQLLDLKRRVRDRIINTRNLTQLVPFTLLAIVGLLFGIFLEMQTGSYGAFPWLPMAVFAGLGYFMPRLLWRHCSERFFDPLGAWAHENLLDRGLLLAALEPVPTVQLLDVFEVPGRERGTQGTLPLPTLPRALNEQKFETRLRLLLERYPKACQALGLEPWPRTFMRLQLDVELGRIYLPGLAVMGVLMLSFFADKLPQSIVMLFPALALSLLVLRWALGDILRTLSFAALNGTVAEILAGDSEPAAQANARARPRSASLYRARMREAS
jgi:hypothetical protein